MATVQEFEQLIEIKRNAVLMLHRRGYQIPDEEQIFLQNTPVTVEQMYYFLTARAQYMHLSQDSYRQALSYMYVNTSNSPSLTYYVLIFEETEKKGEEMARKFAFPEGQNVDSSRIIRYGLVLPNRPATENTKKPMSLRFETQVFYNDDFFFDKTRHSKTPLYEKVDESQIVPLTRRDLQPLPRTEFMCKYYDWPKGTLVRITYRLDHYPIESEKALKLIQKTKIEFRVVV